MALDLTPIAAGLFKVVTLFGGAQGVVTEVAALVAAIPGLPEAERRALSDPEAVSLGIAAAQAVYAFEQKVAADIAG